MRMLKQFDCVLFACSPHVDIGSNWLRDSCSPGKHVYVSCWILSIFFFIQYCTNCYRVIPVSSHSMQGATFLWLSTLLSSTNWRHARLMTSSRRRGPSAGFDGGMRGTRSKGVAPKFFLWRRVNGDSKQRELTAVWTRINHRTDFAPVRIPDSLVAASTELVKPNLTRPDPTSSDWESDGIGLSRWTYDFTSRCDARCLLHGIYVRWPADDPLSWNWCPLKTINMHHVRQLSGVKMWRTFFCIIPFSSTS